MTRAMTVPRTIATILLWLALASASYSVDRHIFHAVVDHYTFHSTRTFPLRYFVNDDHWNENSGPCFFYAGNEANIFQFINNSGFLFDASKDFGALVVFAEHRYYGESIISDDGDMSFLTVEQAMADFNTLNLHIRNQWNMTSDTAFIAFGGSYGGNLAMWLRLKNPNLWAGAIASSATPLKHLLRETNAFGRIETEAYGNVSAVCPQLVRLGWKELYGGAATQEGRDKIANALGLCNPLQDSTAADEIHGWVSDALETMVQYGYPYPTTFYNPVPAYPFRVACEKMLSVGTGLGALRAAVDVYHNHTGQAGACFDFDSMVVSEAMRHWERKGDRSQVASQRRRFERRHKEESGSRLIDQRHVEVSQLTDGSAWGYQTCTEVYQPMPTDGQTDFELPYSPNQTAYYEDCMRQFGVQPRPNWEEMTFMGADISAGSNIFLTSGQLDPWRAAGIQQQPKGAPESIIIRIIENGAHHLDLRGSHPMDPPSVVVVRREEKAAIQQWMARWKATHPRR